MNKIKTVLAFVVIASCVTAIQANAQEKFNLLRFGTSVNEGRKILKRNAITITDEEAGIYDDGDTFCMITTKGTLYDKQCYIEYQFMDDKLIQGFYKFNDYDHRYYSADEIEDIKLLLIQKFTERYNKAPETYFPSSYHWILDNKIAMGIVQIADDILIVEHIGIEYLLSLEISNVY